MNMDESKYSIHNEGTLQGRVVGHNVTVNQPYYGRITNAPPSSPPSRVGNVPYRRNPFFTGRETLLTLLHNRLTDTKTATLTQTQAISGLGGIGKTETALEYAYRYRDDYQTALWVNAATRETLLTDFLTIATLLRLPEHEEQDQDIVVTAVKDWFARHTGWLLILDNADDLEMAYHFLPIGEQGHIILTTRAQAAGAIAHPLDVEKMDTHEGTLLLLRRARVLARDGLLEQVSPTDFTTAEAIVNEVDGLPLALDHAGAYIEEIGCSLSQYLSLYRTRQQDLLRQRSALPSLHPEPVATTWSLSFYTIKEANPAAAELLQMCAFLAPDAIPEEVFSEGAAVLGPVLGPIAKDAWKFNDALRIVRQYSLIRRDAKTHTLSIHRLVQAILKEDMPRNTQCQWAERVIRALNIAFPAVEQGNLSPCEPYLVQTQVVTTLIDSYRFRFTEAADLLTQPERYPTSRPRYPNTQPP